MLAGQGCSALGWLSGPLQSGHQKELLIVDALSQIECGGCRAERLLHPLRLQERVLPGSSGTGRPKHSRSGRPQREPQEGEPVCRPARSSFWNSLLADGVTSGLVCGEAGWSSGT